MQEIWNFKVPPKLQNRELKDILKEVLSFNKKELGIFLSYYFKKEGAVAEKVELVGGFSFIDQLSGNFSVDFDLIYFNACLNIHEKNRDKMQLRFEFEPDLKELKLIGPYWPEREMDDI